jgi:hypothetical protein
VTRRGALIVAAMLLAAACGKKAPPTTCKTSEDCGKGQRCLVDSSPAHLRNTCVSLETYEVCLLGEACGLYGGCFYDGDRCRARTAADCEQSRRCPADGQCRLDPAGECVADDQSCAASRVCAVRGSCAAWDGQCLRPGEKASDCDRELGTDKVNVCREYGYCTPLRVGDRSFCAATGPGDCQGSILCKEEGRCHYRDGGCFTVP